MNKQNRVKIVFKVNNQGIAVASCGDLFTTTQFERSELVSLLNACNFDSLRACKGNKVFEVHVDKYKNVIYREYEKK